MRVMWLDGEASLAQPSELCALEAAGAFGGPYELQFLYGLAAYKRSSDVSELPLVLSLSADEAAGLPQWSGLGSACAERAVLVFTPSIEPAVALRLLQSGVQDIVLHRDVDSLAQRLSLAVERKRLEADLLKAHATDLETGLPNRQQLIEHMSQLLALREREGLPVSLLVLRIDGLEGIESGHGQEAANVVRRKVAVRLRAGVRASDVVASLGANVFALLLPVAPSQADTPHVIEKLLRAVRQPFRVAGRDVGLSASIGAAHFPQDGLQPEALLHHAAGEALLGADKLQDAAND